MTTVTPEDVLKALNSLQEGNDEVVKASDSDLDQPEGADLGNPAKDKLSSKAPAPVKKGEGEEEEDDEDMDDSMDKSELPEEVQTKIEVSDFLKSLVDHNVEGLNKLAGHIAKSDAANDTRFADVTEAIEGLAKSQAKIGIVLKALCEKMGVIENSPARPAAKAETVAKSEAVVERQMASALESEKGEEKMFKSLSENPAIAKSQISNAICDLVMKGQATDMDVINFESAGFISPELASKLKGTI